MFVDRVGELTGFLGMYYVCLIFPFVATVLNKWLPEIKGLRGSTKLPVWILSLSLSLLIILQLCTVILSLSVLVVLKFYMVV